MLAHLCAWKAGGKYFAREDRRDYDELELLLRAERACSWVIDSSDYQLASSPEEVCTEVLVGGSKESIFESVYRLSLIHIFMAGMTSENENGGEGELHEMEILYAAINQLPLERRRVFMMICAEGMKYQDVADALGFSINTVRTQMGRSMKFLRERCV